MKLFLGLSKLSATVCLAAAGGFAVWFATPSTPRTLVNEVSPNGSYRFQVIQQPSTSYANSPQFLVVMVNTHTKALIEATTIPVTEKDKKGVFFADWDPNSTKVTLTGLATGRPLVFYCPVEGH